MNREMDMAEVSDGKLYGLDDMVKADCAGCEGCHACCTGMGTSVVLDPFDAYRMTAGTGKTFEALLAGPLELNVVDGIILPNLKMAGRRRPVPFLTRMDAAGFMRTAQGSAGCFRLEEFMGTAVLSIFCRFTSARRRPGPR